MTTGWPMRAAAQFAQIRATVSTPPPGADGTISLMGLAGQVSCACAPGEAMAQQPAASSAASRRRLRAAKGSGDGKKCMAGFGSVETGQTQAVMDSVCRTLEQVGSSVHDVVKVNVWLSDLADFAAFNAVYAGYFNGGKYPVRSLVQAGLAFNVKVEVEVQALDRQQAGH